MPNLDIPVSADVQAMLDIPPCADLRLPQFRPATITLPTGAAIKAIADVSKGIPTSCALNVSLMIQLAPLLASMECLLRILKLLGSLVKVIKGLPFPPIKAISDFIQAATELAPCLALPVNIPGLLQMVHDVLCLVVRSLKCVVDGLNTVVKTLKGLSIQLKIATDEGNTELVATLQCAQENAMTSSASLMQSIEPISAILDLVTPIMEMAGMSPFKMPALAPAADVAALEGTVQTLQGVVDSLNTIASALPGGSCV
jgi:hypothetical protein